MKKTRLAAGMQDKLFKRARVMYQIERQISDALMATGFHRIETPTLEHYQVFGDEVNPTAYNLFDQKGDLLTLRSDVTSQIARVIASTRVHTPIKFSYSGKVFHCHEAQRGLANEATQAGVEIVGYPVQQALKEALVSARQALEVAGVKVYQFEFSHASILQLIFEELALSESQRYYLAGLIRDKSITGLKAFTQAYPSIFDSFIQQLPYLFGDVEEVLAAARQLTQHEGLLSALDSLELLTQSVAQTVPRMSLDLAQLSDLPYYTGMMFKVFGDKVPDAFVSGGRYDKLFERFGAKELTAVGWAMDIDSVYQAIYDDLDFGGDGNDV
ncbi:ATP phosphoribosyltransferase regulatory subunit [Streptococcus rupicaprae]|uniref:ATP phosphoribosyltransferase regulatory subunit n=1 Tax=Streptococcus rupicaprae TaxID=759619 RepID=A0ABV2FK46_9STRE